MARTETIEIPFATTGDKQTQQNITSVNKTLTDLAKQEVEANKARTLSWTELNSVIGVSKQVYEVAAGAVREVWGEYSKLSEEVRDLSLVSGTSAEEASRFIQVLDDYQLTAEDATTASRFLKEKGLTPTIDTLIDLSRQFKQIEDPAKRLEFIQENLGRGGAKWVNILNQEEDQIRTTAAAIDEKLILDDEQIAKYEQQRLALDAVNDSVQAAKVGSGQFVGELILENQVIQRATDLTLELGGTYNDVANHTDIWKEAMNQARKEQEDQTQAMLDNEEAAVANEQAIEDLVKQQKELSDTLSKQVSLINTIQAAEDKYTEQSKDLADQRAEAEAKVAELRAQGYWEQSQQVQDAIAKVDEIRGKEAELAADREKQAQEWVDSLLEQNLARDGWTQAEFDAYTAHKLETGAWSQEVVDEMRAAWTEADKITASINNIPAEKIVTVKVSQVVDSATQSYTAMAQYYSQPRDSGGAGQQGQAYMIGRGAQPEMFVAPADGQFVPNADKWMKGNQGLSGDPETKSLLRQIANQKPLNESRLALLIRDALQQA